MSQTILLTHKPSGISSHSFIKQIQTKLKCSKIGHSGTLDQLASGLMIVLINQGTKLSEFVMGQSKTYKVTAQLFEQSSTGDLEGSIIRHDASFYISENTLKKALQSFNNKKYDQLPPLYSAIKIKGKALYKYARQNQTVPELIKKRRVKIHDISSITYNKVNLFQFEVSCSKGTYIRSLVEDIGIKLKTCAKSIKIVRTKIDTFNLAEASLLEDVTWEKVRDGLDIINRLNYPTLVINCDFAKAIQHGQIKTLPKSLLSPLLLTKNDIQYVFLIYQETLFAVFCKQSHQNYVYYKLLI